MKRVIDYDYDYLENYNRLRLPHVWMKNWQYYGAGSQCCNISEELL